MPASPTARERLWMAFVNADALGSFERLVAWMHAAGALDADRLSSIRRRAALQPAAASAALADARRMHAALRQAARAPDHATGAAALAAECNRVLGRTTGVRRVEATGDGWRRAFATVGDAFAGLLLPVAESAADALVAGEWSRVRACANPDCPRLFVDHSRGARRRWCAMAGCGNRAKVAALRARRRPVRALAVAGERAGSAVAPAATPRRR
jgi:predicted RNA-binding Zn ribbon-like protein